MIPHYILVFLLIVAGILLFPYLIAALMDLISIELARFAHAIGIEGVVLGLGFAQSTLPIWPGGQLVMLFTNGGQGVTVPGLIGSVLSLVVAAMLISFIRPLPFAKGLRGMDIFHAGRNTLIGLVLNVVLDGCLVLLACMVVSFVFMTLGRFVFSGPFAAFAFILFGGGGLIAAIAVTFVSLSAAKVGKAAGASSSDSFGSASSVVGAATSVAATAGDPFAMAATATGAAQKSSVSQGKAMEVLAKLGEALSGLITFKMLFAIAKYALITGAFIVWSASSIAGWLSIVGCFIANYVVTFAMAKA